GRMADQREQSPRQVLSADGLRPTPARAAARALEPCLVRGDQCAGGRVTLLHRFGSIVRWIARRATAEQDLDDELQSFVDMAAADQIRDGATPADARRRAVIQLGGLQARRRTGGSIGST